MTDPAETYHFAQPLTVDLFWSENNRPRQSTGTLVSMNGSLSGFRMRLKEPQESTISVKFHIRLGPILLESGNGTLTPGPSNEVDIGVLCTSPGEPTAIAVRLSPFLTVADRERFLRRVGSEVGPSRYWDSWVMTGVRLSHLVDISTRINSSESLESLLAEIMEAAKEIMDAEASSLMLLDGETGELVIAVPTGPARAEISGVRIPAGKGFAGWVAGSGTPLVVPEAEKDPRFYGEVSKGGFRTRNLICVPMHDAEGKLIGVLQALNRRAGGAFTEDDIPLFVALSNQAAVAIEKARLHTEALEKQQLDRELSLARSIQLGFLPKSMPSIPGFQFAGLSEPAAQVGGDYFDVIQLDDRTCGLVVADISGKGFSAALLMATLRAALRNQIKQRAAVAETISLLNTGFVDDSPTNRFVTLFYGELDVKNHEFSYVNAGHNPPFLFSKDSQVLLKEGGPIVGFRKGLAFESGTVRLQDGDILVMFTDGIVEAQNADELMFGDERLCDAVLAGEGTSRTASEVLTSIQRAVLDFVGDARQYDDLTLLVVKASGG